MLLTLHECLIHLISPYKISILLGRRIVLRMFLNLRQCVKVSKYGGFFWSVFSCIQSEYREIRARKTPYLGTFHAVRI